MTGQKRGTPTEILEPQWLQDFASVDPVFKTSQKSRLHYTRRRAAHHPANIYEVKKSRKKLKKVLQISELCSMLYNREEFGAISDQ